MSSINNRTIFDEMTQESNATLFVNKFTDKVRFNIHSGKWLQWNEIHWLPEQGHEDPAIHLFREVIKDMIERLSTLDSHEERDAWNRWIKKSQTLGHMQDVIKLASTHPTLHIRQPELDSHPFYLNCLNGTINLETNELQPHCKEDYLTRYIPVEYHADQSCPFFIEFLNTIMDNDQEVIEYIQRAVGYSLTGVHSEEVLFFLYGTGKNGKTTFMNTIASLFGVYQQRIGINSILQSNSERIKTEFAQLPGVRIVHTSEIPENKKLDESLVKDLTGGDPIKTRFLYKEWFEFKPVFKLWMFGNHKPIITGNDEGIWRRIKLIPFTVEIPKEKRISRRIIEGKLQNELSGILNWAIEGCMKWQKEGLIEPDTITESTQEYRNEMNILSLFINDTCQFISTESIELSILYDMYKQWCTDSNIQSLGKNIFGKKIIENFPQLKKDKGTHNVTIISGISKKVL